MKKRFVFNLTSIGAILVCLAQSLAAGETKFPLTNTDVLIHAWQEEVGTARNNNVAAMSATSGLLGGLIAASTDRRASTKAEEAVVQIREALVGYEYSQVFADKLMASIEWEQVASGATPGMQTVKVNWADQQPLERPRLEVLPEVFFSTNLNTLVVRVRGILVSPSNRQNGEPELQTLQRYEFAWPVTHLRKKTKRAAAAEAWAELPAERLIELIELGMDTVIELWNYHLENPILPGGSGLWNPLYTAEVQYARKIDERDGLVWLKRSSGSSWLYAVHPNVFWAKVSVQ